MASSFSRAALPTEQANSIRDTATGTTIELDDLVEKLATADIVFLGETHTDETTHRLQLEIFRALLSKKQQRRRARLDMFERDVQTVLEGRLEGAVSEAEFLEQARPWSNYQEANRPSIEEAKKSSAPVVTGSFPAELVRKVAIEGSDSLESLSSPQATVFSAIMAGRLPYCLLRRLLRVR